MKNVVVIGGGTALYNASIEVSRYPRDFDINIALGKDIVVKACKAPFIKILANAGKEDWHDIATTLLQFDSDTIVYNAKTTLFIDAFTEGLLDPFKVVRIALENAASISSVILTTESVLFKVKEEKKNTLPEMEY